MAGLAGASRLAWHFRDAYQESSASARACVDWQRCRAYRGVLGNGRSSALAMGQHGEAMQRGAKRSLKKEIVIHFWYE